MKVPKEILQIAEYISHNYSEPLTSEGYIKEDVTLSTIKEFTGFEYDAKNKFFMRDIDGVYFATELVELDSIDSIVDLHQAIEYLKDAHKKRKAEPSKMQNITLDEQLYIPPTNVQPISRSHIDIFLKEEYNIQNESELFALDENAHKNAIYGMYRKFTGYIPIKREPNRVLYIIPDKEGIGMGYSNVPDFENNTSLFSHIRSMRKINKHTKEQVKELSGDRLAQLEAFKDRKDQDIER